MTRSIVYGALAAALLMSAPAAATAQSATGASGLKIVDRIAGPDGGWDYSTYDPERHRIYVARGSDVMTIDLATGKTNPKFAAGSHLHGVVPVPGTNLLVSTNGGDTSAKILNATTGALIASVPTPKDPDSAIYDPHTKTMIVVGGDSGTVSMIDPKAAKAVGEIDVGGGLEFAIPDGKGRLFVNGEDNHEIVVIDLDAKKVVARYPMAGCLRPTGLALVSGHRLISSCQSVAKIIDSETGKDIATLPIGVGPDAVIYDSGRGMAYVPSGRSGTLAVIALRGPGANTVIDTVKTQVGARSGAVDPATGKLYLPAAEYGPPVTGQRPAMKPGTFQVLVLGK